MFALAWTPTAFEQMGLILLALPERKASFSRTLRFLTQTLCTEPSEVGESRAWATRVWFVGNLLVTYSVDEGAEDVLVLSVRLASVP